MGLIRTGGGLTFLVGIVQTLGSVFCGIDSDEEGHSHCSGQDGRGLMPAGGLIYLVGTGYNLIDIPFAARRERSLSRRIGLGPRIRPGPGGVSPGRVAWIRF